MEAWTANLVQEIRALARAAAAHRPLLNHLEMVEEVLRTAARSVERGDLSQGALQLYFACCDLYAALDEVRPHEHMVRQIREAVEHRPNVYLDTVIISAMERSDQDPLEMGALNKVLDAAQAGRIRLCTSTKAREELTEIPEKYRGPHLRLYRLLDLVPHVESATPSDGDSTSATTVDELRERLDENDFQHVINAAMNRVQYLLTCDGDIWRQREVVRGLGLTVIKPSEVAAKLEL